MTCEERLAAVERERDVRGDQLLAVSSRETTLIHDLETADADRTGWRVLAERTKNERDAAQAEVARLRAALQEIHDVLDRGESTEDFWRITRAALAGGKDTP